MSGELIVGPDGTNAKEQLRDLIGDDVLFDRISELAAQDPDANLWDDTDVQDILRALGIQMPDRAAPDMAAQPEQGVAEGDGNPDIRPGMKVSQGTVVKVNGNTVIVKTSNGDMMTMNIHDVDQAVSEGSQRVDSLVTDALKIMRGSDYQVDAVKAIKTVLGEREYNSRRGYYSFYVRQLMDMHGQEGIAETKKPSPKLTAVDIKKTAPVSEEINNEAYERLQKVFAFKNYES
jgi:hypothetical protein